MICIIGIDDAVHDSTACDIDRLAGLKFDLFGPVDARRKIDHVGIVSGNVEALRLGNEKVKCVVNTVDLDREIIRAGQRKGDGFAVDLRYDTSGERANDYVIHIAPADDLDRGRAFLIPVCKTGDLGLVERPLITRPDLVDRHGGHATLIHKNRFIIYVDRNQIEGRFALWGRIVHNLCC